MLDIYARWLMHRRWLVIVAMLLIVGLFASGARFLQFTNDYRAFFYEDNPQRQAFEEMQATYAKADNVLFVITPKDGKVFSQKTLESLQWLTDQAWQTPYSNRVESVTNFQHTQAEGDDLSVGDLVTNAAALSDQQIDTIKNIALNEPLLLKRLINPDATVTGVNVTVQLPGKSLTETPEIAQFAQKLADELQARDSNLRVDLTGIVMMNNTFSVVSASDMSRLVPIMFAIIIVLIGFMLRSVVPVAITVLLIALSILVGMGTFGWSGLKMTTPLATAPTIILTVAVADAVHIFVTYMAGLSQGRSREDAMAESIRLNFFPVSLTSITTIFGFLTMNFTEVPPLAHLGNTVAAGIAGAWVLSLTLLPSLAVMLPVKAAKARDTRHPFFDALASFVVKRRQFIVVAFGTVTVICAFLIPKNEINDEFVKYFDESVTFRQATDYATKVLLGPYTQEFSIDSGSENGIADPEFLQRVERFVEFAKAQPEVSHVFTFTDIIKRLNKNMHGDDEAYYRLPDNRELSAQYLLLYEMSLPYGLDLTNQVNLDKSATKVTLSLRNLSSAEQLRLESRLKGWLTSNYPGLKVSVASTTLIFAHIGQRNATSQTWGIALSLIFIPFILIVALRSIKIGLVSLIPNLVPPVLAFGIWAVIDGQVGMTVALVAGVTLGIVVDDTIHFLSKYMRARRTLGMDAEQAIHYAFNNVGSALIVTTVVLVSGFSVLLLSLFKLNGDLGAMASMTFAIALLLDLLLLPALLIYFDGDKKYAIDKAAKADVAVEPSV